MFAYTNDESFKKENKKRLEASSKNEINKKDSMPIL